MRASQNGEVFLYDLETNEQRKLAEGKTVQNVIPGSNSLCLHIQKENLIGH